MKKKRQPNQTITCEWCGERKEVCRADAKTCGPRCRSRLSRYTLQTGFPPIHPPGRITVQDALDLLILELFARERARRELVSINNARAAELMAQRPARS
jgi:hypothetical protein